MAQNMEMERLLEERSAGMLRQVVDGVVSKVLSNADAKTVFGEPVTSGARTVVPVARISYRFGFGAGGGQGPDRTGEGGGGGGAGSLNAQPAGFIEVTGDSARFVPVVEPAQVLATLAKAFVTVAIVGIIFGRGRRNRKGRFDPHGRHGPRLSRSWPAFARKRKS